MTFRKGQSGNPAGRPKRKLITDALVAELQSAARGGKISKAEAGARKLVRMFLAGDVQAAKLVLSYVEGLPVQPVEFRVREEARRIAARTGADPDWLIKRAEEIAAGRAD